MDAASWARAKDILAEALKRSAPEREAFVRAQSATPELAAEILDILSAYADSTEFLRSGSSSQAEEDAVIPVGTHVGPYVIVDHIGRGGMGRVYLGSDPRLRRKVALKCLLRPASGPADTQILLEAIAAARVSHSNVAAVYDVIEHQGRVFIVMEYVDGESLAARLKRERIPIDRVIEIGHQLSSALAAAHAKGIVHRDLKPGNVHFTTEGSAKVLDFGIAELAQSLTVGTNISTAQPPKVQGLIHPGTPPYMSPEQLMGGTVDERSDIFSLGVVLFEMATGRRPFLSSDTQELIVLQARGAPRADAVDGKVPRALADVIGRTLDTEVARRPQSALELDESLHAIAESRRRKTARELVRVWTARVAVGVPLVILAVGVLGEFKTLAFNNNFGRTGPFSRFGIESWSSLLLWGVAGNASKILTMIVITFIVLAARALFRALELFEPIGRLTAPVRRACRNASRRVGLDDPIVFAQAIAALGVLLMIAVAWRHQDLMNAWTVSFNSAPIERLLPMRESSFERFQYHLELSLVTLGLLFGLYGVRRLQRREGARNSRVAVGMVVAVLIAVVLLDDAPFRSFNHRDFERADYAGMHCYIIGASGDEFLVLCPGSEPPRNHAVKDGDPQLQRLQKFENVFRGVNVGPAVP
ncbi:MAG TPA: serine/threonine-protein kinase [Vicinamibacterales bacterium]|jgi:serine/threonine protein kinase